MTERHHCGTCNLTYDGSECPRCAASVYPVEATETAIARELTLNGEAFIVAGQIVDPASVQIVRQRPGAGFHDVVPTVDDNVARTLRDKYRLRYRLLDWFYHARLDKLREPEAQHDLGAPHDTMVFVKNTPEQSHVSSAVYRDGRWMFVTNVDGKGKPKPLHFAPMDRPPFAWRQRNSQDWTYLDIEEALGPDLPDEEGDQIDLMQRREPSWPADVEVPRRKIPPRG